MSPRQRPQLNSTDFSKVLIVTGKVPSRSVQTVSPYQLPTLSRPSTSAPLRDWALVFWPCLEAEKSGGTFGLGSVSVLFPLKARRVKHVRYVTRQGDRRH
jgi:hypothetical protein